MLRESCKIKTLVAVSLVIGASLLAGCNRAGEGAANVAAMAWAEQEGVEPKVSPTATIVALVMVVIVGAGMVAGVWFRRRIPPLESRYKCTVEPTAWEGQADLPLMQTTTRYFLGDERFDPSFRIQTATDTFLGEYGVGIIPAVAQGEKMPAFEVWLFDRHDPEHTDSQLLVSEHAFHDRAMQTRLIDIGPLALAQLGQTLTLQTATLRVRARVLEMAYVIGEKFDNRFFKELTVELAAWQLTRSNNAQTHPGRKLEDVQNPGRGRVPG